MTSPTPLSGIAFDHAPLLSPNLACVPQPALGRLRENAAAVLALPPLSVVQKTGAPPSGDKHDYMSVGPYWWPNPATPDHLPYVRRDGEVHPDYLSEKYDTTRLERFASALRDLTLAWCAWRDDAYAKHAARLARAWFLDPATRMNPNLLFGQGIPGICTGRCIGLIDTARFARSLDYLLLLHHAGALSNADLAGLRAWFSAFLDWMLAHEYGQQERREHNNHGTWCDAQLAVYAMFTSRLELARSVIAEVPQRRIFAHIQPDGQQPHELARTRSFSYSCYNLQGLFCLAEAARRLGCDLISARSPDGRCLRAALDFLAPYADPEKPWPHQQINTADNPALGSSPRAPLYPLLRHAAILWHDPRYLTLAAQHPASPTDYTAALLWPA